jgi:hypothetical protein
MRDDPDARPNRFDKLSWFHKALIGTVTGSVVLIAGLLVLELVLRTYYRRPLVERYFSPAANIAGYGLQKSTRFEYLHNGRSVTVSIDSEGRRIVPGAPEQAPVTLYVIGDSQVFGWGLNDSESIPARLQQRLGPGWRVINLGVPGYGPFQYYEELSQIPDDAVALVIQTEANDLQDAYAPPRQLFSRCGYLVPRGWFGERTPCFLLSSYVLAKITELRLKISGELPVPLGYNPHAQVAARVLAYRTENLYRSALEKKTCHVIFAVIPWDAALDAKRLSNYRPRLSHAERFTELTNECELDRDFRQQTDVTLLFQKGDAHLSAAGADFVAAKLAPTVVSALSSR